MSNDIFQKSIDYLHERLSALPDRRIGDNSFISMKDIGLSAFSVFFTQSSSFLEHQKLLNKRTGRNNAKSLFVGALSGPITAPSKLVCDTVQSASTAPVPVLVAIAITKSPTSQTTPLIVPAVITL